jgi:hypothetical protein
MPHIAVRSRLHARVFAYPTNLLDAAAPGSRAPRRGVDLPGPARNHLCMEQPTPAAIQRLQALVELREQLAELNAKLEYARLMLQLRAPIGPRPQ